MTKTAFRKGTPSLFAKAILRLLFAFGTDIVNGQFVARNILANRLAQPLGKPREADVCQFSAKVAAQMVVVVAALFKAIGAAVHMDAADHADVGHGVQVVINGRHGNARHLQFGKKENFVGGQVTVGVVEDLQDQFALFGHGVHPEKTKNLESI